MTGIGENTLAQPVKPPLRKRRACLAKLVKNRLTLTISALSNSLPRSVWKTSMSEMGKESVANADLTSRASFPGPAEWPTISLL